MCKVQAAPRYFLPHPMVQTRKPPILPASKGYFLMTSLPKYVTKYPLLREPPGGGGRVRAGRGRGGRGAAGPLAGVPGRGRGRGAGAGGGEAACREQPRAGRARGARAPAGAGRGREEPERPPPLPEEPRGRHTRPPSPPAFTRTHTRAQEAGGPGPTGPPWTPTALGAETPASLPSPVQRATPRSLHAVPVPERHALHAVDERVHCADTLACSFICGRAQGCLHLLAAVNSVVIRIHVQALSEHLFRCCGAGTQQRNG
ncbi:uncharacterized protein LOC108590274 isoform X10 [Callithrix jacchus]